MRRMRFVFTEQFFELDINRRVTAIMTDLKNIFAFLRGIEKFFRVVQTDWKRLFAKYVLARIYRPGSYFRVSFIRSRH